MYLLFLQCMCHHVVAPEREWKERQGVVLCSVQHVALTHALSDVSLAFTARTDLCELLGGGDDMSVCLPVAQPSNR